MNIPDGLSNLPSVWHMEELEDNLAEAGQRITELETALQDARDQLKRVASAANSLPKKHASLIYSANINWNDIDDVLTGSTLTTP